MFAPAKINLFLHVGDRRADGFHTLESLVVFADVGDEISFEKAGALSLTVRGPFADELSEGGNLVLRAAEAFALRTGQVVNAQITLTKNLPVASGIGGGSADAAATLRELAVIYPGADEALLLRIAEELGSDVPACLQSHALMMRGRGEVLEAAPRLPEIHALLVNPRVAVATGQVFIGLKQRSSVGAVKMPDDLSRGLIRFLLGTRNDLEAPARTIAPVIGQALDEIARMPGILLARMSGSGATCFGLFETSLDAELAATAISHSHPNWWVRPARLG